MTSEKYFKWNIIKSICHVDSSFLYSRRIWRYQNSESVNRRTDYTRARWKRTKGQSTIYNTIHI